MVEEGALFSKQLNIFHGNTIVESLSLWPLVFMYFFYSKGNNPDVTWLSLSSIHFLLTISKHKWKGCSKLDTQQFAGQWVVYYGSQDILYFVLSWWALRGIIRFCKGQILWIVNFFHVHGNLKSWIYLSNAK